MTTTQADQVIVFIRDDMDRRFTDLKLEMRDGFEGVRRDMAHQDTDWAKTSADHEARLRTLEDRTTRWSGVFTVLTLLAGAGVVECFHILSALLPF